MLSLKAPVEEEEGAEEEEAAEEEEVEGTAGAAEDAAAAEGSVNPIPLRRSSNLDTEKKHTEDNVMSLQTHAMNKEKRKFRALLCSLSAAPGAVMPDISFSKSDTNLSRF